MTRDINFKRGGQDFSATLLQQGRVVKLNILPDETDPEYGDAILEAPVKTEIERDLDGTITSIKETWARVQLAPNGKPRMETYATGTKTLTDEDIVFWAENFGLPIMLGQLNGYAKIVRGFADKPVVGPDGSVLAYTAEQENEAPTFDYYGPVVSEEPVTE